jgi:hypothetical protein
MTPITTTLGERRMTQALPAEHDYSDEQIAAFCNDILTARNALHSRTEKLLAFIRHTRRTVADLTRQRDEIRGAVLPAIAYVTEHGMVGKPGESYVAMVVDDAEKLRVDLLNVAAEASRYRDELHAIDSTLGNVRAFDGLETRGQKIAHAMSEAKRADFLQNENARLRDKVEALEREITVLQVDDLTRRGLRT